MLSITANVHVHVNDINACTCKALGVIPALEACVPTEKRKKRFKLKEII